MSVVTRAKQFRPDRAWASTVVAEFDEVTAKLHWTDAGYPWHVNDGDELFVVLDGIVDMHCRSEREPEQLTTLHPGDIWFGAAGGEHRAVPRGEARVLVVERPDSDTLR